VYLTTLGSKCACALSLPSFLWTCCQSWHIHSIVSMLNTWTVSSTKNTMQLHNNYITLVLNFLCHKIVRLCNSKDEIRKNAKIKLRDRQESAMELCSQLEKGTISVFMHSIHLLSLSIFLLLPIKHQVILPTLIIHNILAISTVVNIQM